MISIYEKLIQVADELDLKGYTSYSNKIDNIMENKIVFALNDEIREAAYVGYLKFKSFCNFFNAALDKVNYINSDDKVIVRRLFARALREFKEALGDDYYVPFDSDVVNKYNNKLREVLRKVEEIQEETIDESRVLRDRFLIFGQFELLYRYLKRATKGIKDLEGLDETLDELYNVLQNIIEKNSEEIVNIDLLQYR